MFNELPRYVGFPNQFWCESKFAFNSFEKMFKNKLPFFVSTFGFKDKNTPIVDNLFFDIDSYYGLRYPYRNIKALKEWCYKHDLPYLITCSGGKGFHLFILTKPVIAKTAATQTKVRDMMYSIQMRIVEELKLEAFDEPTFARLRFLMRYPTSRYLRKNEETGALDGNGMYCRHLTDELFDSGLKRMRKHMNEPGEIPKPPKSDITFQHIADLFDNFKVRHRRDAARQEKIMIQRAGSHIPTIAALGLPCMKDFVSHGHPTHFERIELVAFMKYLGYTDLAINAFIKNRNWTRYDYSVTSYQIRTINPRPPKCTFLRKSYGNLCEKCPFKKRSKKYGN